MNLPKYIQEHIFTKVEAMREPNRYAIRGWSGGGYSIMESARKAVVKLKEWAEKQGAEVTVIDDRFTFGGYKQQGKLRIIIEITDPVSKHIDSFIEEARGDLYYSARDRQDWKRYLDKKENAQ